MEAPRLDGLNLAWASRCREFPSRRSLVHSLAPTDEVHHPVIERRRHPRAGDALVTGLKEAGRSHAAQIARVMQKGRNFH